MDYINIKGARTHNLKNISLSLPRNNLIVITGLSGSGKSSLAFDTLYAEGQRRYVESLSAYARQFLDRLNKPDVDLIEGLSPAISIEQKSTSHNPRSTVGTVTEIHDYLRLLFARAGDPVCPEHSLKLEAQTISQIVDQLLGLPEDSKIIILAPIVNNRKGSHTDLINELRAQGFIRVRLDGTIYEIDNLPEIEKKINHQIDVVVDRIKIHPDIKQRITESIETALKLTDGKILTLDMDTNQTRLFSSKFACPHCDYAIPELEPRLFSFNNPMGACQDCDGLGYKSFFDPQKVVAFPQLSLASGAIKGWDKRNQFYFQMLTSLANHYKFDIDTPFEKLSEDIQSVILHGSKKEVISFSYLSEHGKIYQKSHSFEGIINNLTRRYQETDSGIVRDEIAKYLNIQTCPSCNGARLRKEARHVLVGDKNINFICELALKKAFNFFENLNFKGARAKVAEKIIQEIKNRIFFLINVGLDYLSLSRNSRNIIWRGGTTYQARVTNWKWINRSDVCSR